jgi:hypothetical protein
MLGYYEHEHNPNYKLAVFAADDGYIAQFVRGINLEVQTWYNSLNEIMDIARTEGFDISALELKCNEVAGRITIDKQWQAS